MKRTAIFVLTAGLAFPVSAQDYTNYHSGGSAAHANQSAYQQMMYNIDKEYAAERPSNPTYLEKTYDVGNYGDINRENSRESSVQRRSRPLASGGDVFVSKEVNAAKKQRERDLERGHNDYFQPVRE